MEASEHPSGHIFQKLNTTFGNGHSRVGREDEMKRNLILTSVIALAWALPVLGETYAPSHTNLVTITADAVIVDWSPRVGPGLVCQIEWRSQPSGTNAVETVKLGTGSIVEMKPTGQTTNVEVTVRTSPECAKEAKKLATRAGKFILWGTWYEQ
jgi:hypothetical protein